MPQGVIRATRAPAVWRDLLRAYHVNIDGERAGSVRSGETKGFAVAPGEHGVHLTIPWCTSPDAGGSPR